MTRSDDAALEQELLRQNNLIYGALIGVGVVMVQPFLTAGSLDASAAICVIAFSAAIPLLSALILLNRQETFRRGRSRSASVSVVQVVAQLAALTGLVAGIWHITWIAGVVMLSSAVVAFGVHTAGYTRVERDARPHR